MINVFLLYKSSYIKTFSIFAEWIEKKVKIKKINSLYRFNFTNEMKSILLFWLHKMFYFILCYAILNIILFITLIFLTILVKVIYFTFINLKETKWNVLLAVYYGLYC